MCRGDCIKSSLAKPLTLLYLHHPILLRAQKFTVFKYRMVIFSSSLLMVCGILSLTTRLLALSVGTLINWMLKDGHHLFKDLHYPPGTSSPLTNIRPLW